MSNEKRQWVGRVLVLGFLGSLTYAFYVNFGPFQLFEKSGEEVPHIPKYFDYGSIANHTYCNDFFRFRIQVPVGLTGSYKNNYRSGKSVKEQDSALITTPLTSEISGLDLLIIEPEFIERDPIKMILDEKKSLEEVSSYTHEKNQRERFGAPYLMAIRASRLSGSSLNHYMSQFTNLHNPSYGSPQFKTISGISFRELHGIEEHGDDAPGRVMFRMLGGKNKNIISFTTTIHDFALSIDLFYQTEEQKLQLFQMVDSISFH